MGLCGAPTVPQHKKADFFMGGFFLWMRSLFFSSGGSISPSRLDFHYLPFLGVSFNSRNNVGLFFSLVTHSSWPISFVDFSSFREF